jgi:hypothetical protein
MVEQKRLYPEAALYGFLLAGQETLNNEGIIKLVKAWMTEEVIINVIRQQPELPSELHGDCHCPAYRDDHQLLRPYTFRILL